MGDDAGWFRRTRFRWLQAENEERGIAGRRIIDVVLSTQPRTAARRSFLLPSIHPSGSFEPQPPRGGAILTHLFVTRQVDAVNPSLADAG